MNERFNERVSERVYERVYNMVNTMMYRRVCWYLGMYFRRLIHHFPFTLVGLLGTA